MDSCIKSPTIPIPKDGISLDKGNLASDNGAISYNVKAKFLEDKNYQPGSNTDSTTL